MKRASIEDGGVIDKVLKRVKNKSLRSLISWLLTAYLLVLLLWAASEVRLLFVPDPKHPLSEFGFRFFGFQILAASLWLFILFGYGFVYGLATILAFLTIRLRRRN